MMLAMICAALAGPVMAAAPCLPGKDGTVQLKEAAAVAYGEGGIPLFKADRAFILSFAENPEGKVFQVDSTRRRVRVSSQDKAEVWLSCDELQTLASCTQESGSEATTPAKPRSRVTRGGGVPNCPGDPRCPKLGSK